MPREAASSTLILVAGATGNLGARLVRELQAGGATVRALVRPGTDHEKIDRLRGRGAKPAEADLDDAVQLTEAARGAACVISTLQGLRPVIVGAQTNILRAAVAAGVPRFIPSDFSLDFFKTTPGSNRNLDLRREFDTILDQSPIKATSVLNGAFTELLKEQAFINHKLKRVVFWGDPDRLLDFTTMDDTAAFTARVALDPDAPRVLRIAGDQISVRGLAAATSAATGDRYRTFRVGGVGLLAGMIRLTKLIAPGKNSVMPPWQGMQYALNMYSGEGKLAPLDNGRYGDRQWTSVTDFLAST